jgi:FkbM family methyltransferase
MNQAIQAFLRIGQRALGTRVYTMRFGLARGLKRRYGQGFRPKFKLTAEEHFLQQLNLTGKTVFDIGGYIGILALFFARAVGPTGRVVAFEPNPQNFAELLYNVNLNHLTQVSAFQIGLGSATGVLPMQLDPVYPSRGTLSTEWASGFNARRSIDVTVETLDRQIDEQHLPSPDFVKIDVEGFEWEVLQGMQQTLNQHFPDLFIEIHGTLQPHLAANLLAHDYQLRHIEAQRPITKSDHYDLVGGHIYATRHRQVRG